MRDREVHRATSAPSDRSGLDPATAEHRLRHHGPNTLPRVRPPHPLRRLLAQLVHLFALMLWLAAGIALIACMPQLALAIAIVDAAAKWISRRSRRS